MLQVAILLRRISIGPNRKKERYIFDFTYKMNKDKGVVIWYPREENGSLYTNYVLCLIPSCSSSMSSASLIESDPEP